MTAETAGFGDYVLPVLRVPKAPIDNLVFDELGQAVLALHNKIFQGTPIEDTTKYKRDQPISFSNIPKALSYNQILLELTKGRIHVASPIEAVRFWDAVPERSSTYSDTDSGAAYPKEGPNEDIRRIALKITGKQNTKVPILIAGLGIERANNHQHGFTIVRTDYTAAIEAPFLTSDGNLACDPKTGKIVSSKQGVSVYTPGDQSGFRRVYRDRGRLDAWVDDLVDADVTGRVQVVQGAYAPEKNLEEIAVREEKIAKDKITAPTLE